MTDTAHLEPHEIRGDIDGRGLRVRIVASRYNGAIVSGLIEGARRKLLEHHVKPGDIRVVVVPGAFEIPLALETGHCFFDVQIALGCVIRGETRHFDLIVEQCSAGVRIAMQNLSMPIGFGVLAVENVEQARARSGSDNNRGAEAALATIELASLLKKIK